MLDDNAAAPTPRRPWADEHSPDLDAELGPLPPPEPAHGPVERERYTERDRQNWTAERVRKACARKAALAVLPEVMAPDIEPMRRRCAMASVGMEANGEGVLFDACGEPVPVPTGAPPEGQLETSGAAVPFGTLTAAECDAAHDGSYIWKAIVAPRNVVVVYGDPGCGKSVLVPYIVHCVSRGARCFGRRTARGPTLYVPSEDAIGVRRRVAALCRAYGEAPDLHVMKEAVALAGHGAEENVARLVATARSLGATVIAIDTLAASFPDLDENDARGMGGAVRTVRRIANESGAAVVLVHHGAKVDGSTPRGHGVLNGDADATLRLQVKDGKRVVSLGKNRSGSTVAPGIAFSIASRTLAVDADGDDITAPLLVEERDAKPTGTPLTKGQEGWFRDLQALFAEPGAPQQRVVASGFSALTPTREQVREGMKARGRFDPKPDGTLTGSDRTKLSAALVALKDAGKVGLSDKLVWLL